MKYLTEFKIINLVLILLTIYIFLIKKNTIYDYGYIKEFNCNEDTLGPKYCDVQINDVSNSRKITKFKNAPFTKKWYPYIGYQPKVGDTIYFSYDKNSPDKKKKKSILHYYINKYTSLTFFILIITMILLFKYDV